MKSIKLIIIAIAVFILSCSKDDEGTVILVNSAPEILAQSFNASETATDTDILGTVKATDADKDELSYSITANSDGLFEITKAGALSLTTGKTLDFETKTSHEITVEVTDGKAKAAAKITITVIDEKENMPPVADAQNFTIAENSAIDAVVGTVVATDPDGDTLQYSVTNPATATASFDMTDNQITFKAGKLDFEEASSHTVTVTVTDGTLSATIDVVINVTDSNEAPVFADQAPFVAAEDVNTTQIIGTLSVTDPEGSGVNYSITTNSNNLFEINASGQITLASGKALDYETATTHTITVQAADTNGNASQKQVIVNVSNVIENIVETYAGDGTRGNTDGPRMNASFKAMRGIAYDSQGNLYIADAGDSRIRKIDTNGNVTTFAGSTAGYADGTGTAAMFNGPNDIVIDNVDNLYVSDGNNQRIRKITPAGVVTTLAGSGNQGLVNGTGTAASFSIPYGLALDTSNNLYVADSNNHVIRKITPAGVVTTFAGTTRGYANGDRIVEAKFNRPTDIIYNLGDFFVSDSNNFAIRKIRRTGTVVNIAGANGRGFVDGTTTAAKFDNPRGLIIDGSGTIYVVDSSNYAIRKIIAIGGGSYYTSTIAGTGTLGWVDGAALTAKFHIPSGIAINKSNGDIMISEESNRRIRKLILE